MAKSSISTHNHKVHGGKAGNLHPVSLQMFHESGPFRRFLHVSDKELEPTPPPVTFNLDAAAQEKDTDVEEIVKACLSNDAALMSMANLAMDGIQPKTITGNISPWLKQLDWHSYWAGKPVAAIGSLGSDPQRWPSAHANFLDWLHATVKGASLDWMNSLLQAGRQVQATFHAYDDTPSHPYSLDPITVKKRADSWAKLFTLLVHILLDGELLGYFGDDDLDEHLGTNDAFVKIIDMLQEEYEAASEQDFDTNLDVYTDPLLIKKASASIFHASHLLVIQEPSTYGELERLPLVRMFLHLCLSDDGTAHPVNVATSTLVNIEFAMRAIEHHYLLNNMDGVVANMSASNANDAIQAHMKRYLFRDSCSASAHLQSLLRYGTKLGKDGGGSLLFKWSPMRDAVTFGTDVIRVARLQAAVGGALFLAEGLLETLLLADGVLSKGVDLGRYKDNLRNMQPGYSFIQASALDAGLFCLRQAAKGNGAPSIPLIDTSSNQPVFDRNAALQYFIKHDQFTKHLALLIELTSGLPARGTELMQIQHTNTLVGQRNLFLSDGHFFTVLASRKGTGAPKLIPRFLPYNVGILVLYYIMEVVPFVHLLHNAVLGPREPTAMLLVRHTGQPWDTNAISQTLQTLCQQYIGPAGSGLHMRSWRQLSISIDRTLIRPGLPPEEYSDHAHDLQAGHSSHTAEQHYGLDADMLRQLTQESMDAMLAVSERWHAFWGLPSRFQDTVQPFNVLVHQESKTCSSKNMTPDLKRRFDVLEEDVRHIRQKLEHQQPSLHISTVSGHTSRSAFLPQVVSNALYKVTGSCRTKTVEQAQALSAIYCKQSPLIIIMGTGSGKSALFMAPILWLPPASIVVVVVPFAALMQDLLMQCRRAGILASKWSSSKQADRVEGSQLVLVAAENCHGLEFGNWAQELVQQERLAAIFFDECHVCFTQDSFRRAMDKIQKLVYAIPVQQYFLTATMPPADVGLFKSKLGLPEDGTGMIRAATNRRNISYAVEHLATSQDMLFRLKELVQSTSSGAIMIFCMSKGAAQGLAEILRCSCIWSDMKEEEKQKTLARWLQCSSAETDNSERILVGTTAIGTGINPQHVNLVVHWGSAYDMVSYVQESGRAGRAGQAAKAFLLVEQNRKKQGQLKLYVEEGFCRRLAISTYMDGMPITCLSQPDFDLCDLCSQRISGPVTPPRQIIDLDTPPKSDKPQHQQLYSININKAVAAVNVASSAPPSPSAQKGPRPTSTTASNGLAPKHAVASTSASSSHSGATTVNQQLGNTNLLQLLNHLTGRCSLCYLFRHHHTCNEGVHCFGDCHCWSKIQPFLLLSSYDSKINISCIGKLKRDMGEKAKGVACYSCLVPLRICSNTSPPRCTRQYSDIVLPVVAAVLRHTELRTRVLAELGEADTDLSTLEVGLGKAVMYRQQRVSLAYAIFAAAVDMDF